jgi:hypothetical protein
MKHSPATKIPDYLPDGEQYQGHDLRRAKMDTIWSIGSTPRKALAALGRARRWGKLTKFQAMTGGDPAYTWGFRFYADGTGMKAAGIHVPGGVIVTWWK